MRTGTTLALVVVKGNCTFAYNLGDSKIYRFHDGRLLRVANDHTVAEDKVWMGLLTPRQAEKSSERHILTCDIGNRYYASPDFYGPFYDKKFLLCSDGLTEMLNYQEISAIINNSEIASETISDTVNKLKD